MRISDWSSDVCSSDLRQLLCRAEGGRVMAGLLDLDLVAARDALSARTISSTELTSAYLARIAATREPNAYITATADKALAIAPAADERLARGAGRGLDGWPIPIKALACPEGVHAPTPRTEPTRRGQTGGREYN